MGQDIITEIFTEKNRVNVTIFGDDKILRVNVTNFGDDKILRAQN